MSQSQRSGEIANTFVKFLKEDDKILIGDFELDEIKRAIAEFARDSHKPFYKAMEIRAAELESEISLKRTRADKWKDRGIGILIGVIATVIGGIILWHILPE